KAPENRYGSAGEVVDALRPLAHAAQIAVARPSPRSAAPRSAPAVRPERQAQAGPAVATAPPQNSNQPVPNPASLRTSAPEPPPLAIRRKSQPEKPVEKSRTEPEYEPEPWSLRDWLDGTVSPIIVGVVAAIVVLIVLFAFVFII